MHLSETVANSLFSSLALIENIFFALLISFIIQNYKEIENGEGSTIQKYGLDFRYLFIPAILLFTHSAFLLYGITIINANGIEIDPLGFDMLILYILLLSFVAIIIGLEKNRRWKNRLRPS